MNKAIMSRSFFVFFIFISLTYLFGCAGMEFSPPYGFIHKELIEADESITAAQQAGKDAECPEEFTEAKVRRDDAFETYFKCRTNEAIKLALEAKEMADGLCPKIHVAVKPPPPTPEPEPEPKPEPVVVEAPQPKIIDRMTLHINFDTDKAVIKQGDYAKLNEAIEFINKYPDSSVVIEGHTDSTGSIKYNQNLSNKRADAVRNYLITHSAIPASRITARGYGESRPVGTNKTPQGRYNNRRAEILIVSE